ncbi:MAG: hypothetical protein FWD90_02240 [Defluviitaleaceae bacterium]|nr:hypothetical protein [Defluviitaleaceae bacterium]
MALFIVGTSVFSLAVIGLVIILALWTFNDAKVRSCQPPVLWVLLVMLVFPVGIILYLLIGRTKKGITNGNRFKIPAVVMSVIFFLSAVLFVMGIIHFVQSDFSGLSSGRNGTFISSSNSINNREWNFRARSVNGWVYRTLDLNARQLNAFHVSGYSNGNVSLRLEQGERMEAIDITGSFHSSIDMSAFEPGRIRVTLEFDNAHDVDIIVRWR